MEKDLKVEVASNYNFTVNSGLKPKININSPIRDLKDEIYNVKMNIKGRNNKLLPSEMKNQFNDTQTTRKTIKTETDY